jgi:hypothetical protein
MMASDQDKGIELTQAQRNARRNRSVAIGIVLGLFVVIIYMATWAKLGANMLARPM